MKKRLVIIITIMLLVIVFTDKYYCTVYANSMPVNTIDMNKHESQNKLENDLLLTVFSPYIAKSIENYYGESRQFDLRDARIINIKRLGLGTFNFEITISVTTFKGPHNPPYGLDTATIIIDDSGTHVVSFNHKDV